jgi:hypothetical protein
MGLMMVRAEIRPESVGEIEAAGAKLFSALDRERLEGVRYAVCRMPDGVTYLNLLQIDEGIGNPLLALPESREFQANLQGWLARPATAETLTVAGSYRLF